MTRCKIEPSRSFDDLRAAHRRDRAPSELRGRLCERLEASSDSAMAGAPGAKPLGAMLPSSAPLQGSSFAMFFAVTALGALLIWLVSSPHYGPPRDVASSAETHAPESSESAPGAGGRSASGRPCPLAEIPPGAMFDPYAPYLDSDRKLSVHTFQATTPSCGPLVRRYIQLVPGSLGPRTSAPILIALHDRGRDAGWLRVQETRWYFDALAKREGFVLVYANAAPSAATSPRWENSGGWQAGQDAHPEIDDDAYLAEIVRDLTRRGVVSGNNDVLLVGFGEGATMALAAAANRPDRYVGIAAFMPSRVDIQPAIGAPSSRLSRVLLVTRAYESELVSASEQWALAIGARRPELGAPFQARDVRRESSKRSGMSGTPISNLADSDRKGPAVQIVVLERGRDFFVPPGAADPLSLAASRARPGFVDGAEQVWGFLRG